MKLSARGKTAPPWIQVMMLAFCVFFSIGGCEKEEKKQGPPPPPPEVAVVTIAPRVVELTTELPGRTSAYAVTEIRPRVNGIITKRLFKEGSDVEAGQLLYQIDPASFQVTYDSARANLGKSRANLNAVSLKARRIKSLYVEKAVSRQDYDDAMAAVEQAQADLEYWKTSVEAALINLNYTRIKAPIPGRIGKSSVTDGALVTAYQMSPLATIQQLDPMYVDVTQSSAELLRLRRELESGQLTNGDDRHKVKLILEDDTPYPLEGAIEFAEVTVDPTTGSYSVRVVVPNPDHLLLPGMFVRAVLKEGKVEKAILVPQQGVNRNAKGEPVVLVVGGDNKVEQRTIKLDRALENQWLVASGLSVGDRVIVEGSIKVRHGSTVKAVEWTPPESAGKDGDKKEPPRKSE